MYAAVFDIELKANAIWLISKKITTAFVPAFISSYNNESINEFFQS